jgi:N-acylneuraminate cytidylyltransferase/CMP-N,N'-diacetyllegionaminic acid synthase
MKVLFLITARGGSKGLPRKNLREVAGLSLVGYRARSARKSRHCERLIISTDSPEIQAEAARHGAEVPFTRAAELASDTASSVDVILDAMAWVEREGRAKYDAVLLLEPSSPFGTHRDYDAAIDLMVSTGANLVLGVRPTEPNSVFVGPLDEQGRLTSVIDKMASLKRLRRQDLPQEYTMNGALYLFKWDYFRKHKTLYGDRMGTYGYVMKSEYSLEIECQADLHYAEFLVEKGHVDVNYWR